MENNIGICKSTDWYFTLVHVFGDNQNLHLPLLVPYGFLGWSLITHGLSSKSIQLIYILKEHQIGICLCESYELCISSVLTWRKACCIPSPMLTCDCVELTLQNFSKIAKFTCCKLHKYPRVGGIQLLFWSLSVILSISKCCKASDASLCGGQRDRRQLYCCRIVEKLLVLTTINFEQFWKGLKCMIITEVRQEGKNEQSLDRSEQVYFLLFKKKKVQLHSKLKGEN